MCGVGHVTGVIDTSRYRHSFKGTGRERERRERARGGLALDGRRGGPTHFSTVYRYILCVLASRPFCPLFFGMIHTPPSPPTHSCAMKVVPLAPDRVMHEEKHRKLSVLSQTDVKRGRQIPQPADTKCKLCVMYNQVEKEVQADLQRVRESQHGLTWFT